MKRKLGLLIVATLPLMASCSADATSVKEFIEKNYVQSVVDEKFSGYKKEATNKYTTVEGIFTTAFTVGTTTETNEYTDVKCEVLTSDKVSEESTTIKYYTFFKTLTIKGDVLETIAKEFSISLDGLTGKAEQSYKYNKYGLLEKESTNLDIKYEYNNSGLSITGTLKGEITNKYSYIEKTDSK